MKYEAPDVNYTMDDVQKLCDRIRDLEEVMNQSLGVVHAIQREIEIPPTDLTVLELAILRYKLANP